MKLIDSYLSTVAGYLPGKNRSDIEAELKSSLYEQLEEQSAALNRDLNEQEQAEFLKKLGHPLKVAGEYAPQRYLVGPALFPYYWHSLKRVAVIVLLAHLALSVISAVSTDGWGIFVGSLFGRIASSLLITGAFVTLVFGLMESTGQRFDWIEKWNPLSLLKKTKGVAVSSSDLITEIVTNSVALLWWNGLLPLRGTINTDSTSFAIALSPAWDILFWPLNVILGGALLLHGAMMLRRHWTIIPAALKWVFDAAFLVVLVYLLRLSDPVLVNITGDVELERLRALITLGIKIVLWFLTVMTVYELFLDSRIILRVQRNAR